MKACRWMTSQHIMYLSYEHENQQINDNVLELEREREGGRGREGERKRHRQTETEIRARPTSSWRIFTFTIAVGELKRINCSTAGLKYHVPSSYYKQTKNSSTETSGLVDV